jgi:hypothetical protein
VVNNEWSILTALADNNVRDRYCLDADAYFENQINKYAVGKDGIDEIYERYCCETTCKRVNCALVARISSGYNRAHILVYGSAAAGISKAPQLQRVVWRELQDLCLWEDPTAFDLTLGIICPLRFISTSSCIILIF